MNRNQIFAIAGCLVLCAAIYLFAGTKKPKDKTEAPVAANQSSHESTTQAEQLDIEKYINEVNAAITDPVQKEKIQQLTSAQNYRALMAEYQKLDKPLALAWYATRLADTENTAQSYLIAGDYNTLLSQSAPDEKAHNFLIINSLNCYQKALALDSANNNIRVKLAGAYMESGGQPMQGVSILLDVVKRDSTNIPALLMLGKFGIISGQYDKSIARLEKILYLQPENSEALLLMADAYNGSGNRTKAIEMLQRYRKTVKSPAERKEIDKSIQQLKQQPNS